MFYIIGFNISIHKNITYKFKYPTPDHPILELQFAQQLPLSHRNTIEILLGKIVEIRNKEKKKKCSKIAHDFITKKRKNNQQTK